VRGPRAREEGISFGYMPGVCSLMIGRKAYGNPTLHRGFDFPRGGGRRWDRGDHGMGSSGMGLYGSTGHP